MAVTSSFNSCTFGNGTQVNGNTGDVNVYKYYGPVHQRQNSQSISLSNADISKSHIGVQEMSILTDKQNRKPKRVPLGELNQDNEKKARDSALKKSQPDQTEKSPSAGTKMETADVKVQPTSSDARKEAASRIVCTKPNTRSQTKAKKIAKKILQ